MLLFVKGGDVIRGHSIDRLARNLVDLRKRVERIISKGARLAFVKEKLIFSRDDSAMSLLLLSVMDHLRSSSDL